jgi:hypothetical protein
MPDMRSIPTEQSVLSDHNDPPGYMMVSNLNRLADQSAQLSNAVSVQDNAEPWVESKIDRASEAIDAVHDYMKYKESRPMTDLSKMAAASGALSALRLLGLKTANVLTTLEGAAAREIPLVRGMPAIPAAARKAPAAPDLFARHSNLDFSGRGPAMPFRPSTPREGVDPALAVLLKNQDLDNAKALAQYGKLGPEAVNAAGGRRTLQEYLNNPENLNRMADAYGAVRAKFGSAKRISP